MKEKRLHKYQQIRSCLMLRHPGSTKIKSFCSMSKGLSVQISLNWLSALCRYPVDRHTQKISPPFPCRFLPDWLGVLLHGGRGGSHHAAVHLAVLFRREEAEALPVLKRAWGRQAARQRGLWLCGLTPVQNIRHHRLYAHHRPSVNRRDRFILQHTHTWLWKLVLLLRAVL